MRPSIHQVTPTEQAASEASPSPALRFLVVDDDEDIRALVVHMLERLGHGAATAADGVEAIELLATERYDFMLLDLTMPRMSGQDVLRWLREHRQPAEGLRVVVISALAGQQRASLQELGAHAILPKPLRTSQLDRLIADHTPAPRD